MRMSNPRLKIPMIHIILWILMIHVGIISKRSLTKHIVVVEAVRTSMKLGGTFSMATRIGIRKNFGWCIKIYILAECGLRKKLISSVLLSVLYLLLMVIITLNRLYQLIVTTPMLLLGVPIILKNISIFRLWVVMITVVSIILEKLATIGPALLLRGTVRLARLPKAHIIFISLLTIMV